jgi:hypothetical protein
LPYSDEINERIDTWCLVSRICNVWLVHEGTFAYGVN